MTIKQTIAHHPSLDPAFQPLDEVERTGQMYRSARDPASARFCQGVIVAKVLKAAQTSIPTAETLLGEIEDQKLYQIAEGALHGFVMCLGK